MVLASLIALGAASSACAGLFTGFFGADNWQVSGGGTTNFVGTSVLQITGPRSTSGSVTYLDLANYVGQPTVLDFTWALAPEDYQGNPTADVYVNDTPWGSLSGEQSGTLHIPLTSGQHLYFELDSAWRGSGTKGPPRLTITGVPEAGTWLAGVFALGVVGWEVLRRKRHASAPPALA